MDDIKFDIFSGFISMINPIDHIIAGARSLVNVLLRICLIEFYR